MAHVPISDIRLPLIASWLVSFAVDRQPASILAGSLLMSDRPRNHHIDITLQAHDRMPSRNNNTSTCLRGRILHWNRAIIYYVRMSTWNVGAHRLSFALLSCDVTLQCPVTPDTQRLRLRPPLSTRLDVASLGGTLFDSRDTMGGMSSPVLHPRGLPTCLYLPTAPIIHLLCLSWSPSIYKRSTDELTTLILLLIPSPPRLHSSTLSQPPQPYLPSTFSEHNVPRSS